MRFIINNLGVLIFISLIIVILVAYYIIRINSPQLTHNAINDSYTLKDSGTIFHFSFEGPYPSPSGVIWENQKLDLGNAKVYTQIPQNWNVAKVPNNSLFMGKNNSKCNYSTDYAYVITDSNEDISMTFNPSCKADITGFELRPSSTLTSVDFNDQSEAKRYYDAKVGVYRYGPSGGVDPKKGKYS